jgi:hypothetical protein
MFRQPLVLGFPAQGHPAAPGLVRPAWSPRVVRVPSRRLGRVRLGSGAATRILAAVLIEALIVLGFVASSLGLGAEGQQGVGVGEPPQIEAPAPSRHPLPAPGPIRPPHL